MEPSFSLEGKLSLENPVKHDAQTPDVCFESGAVLNEDFRGHVFEVANESVSARVFGGDFGRGLELGEISSIVVIDQYIFHIEVPIDDPLGLQKDQVFHNIFDEAAKLQGVGTALERGAHQELLEGAEVVELVENEELVHGVLDVVDGRNEGMAESGKQLLFLQLFFLHFLYFEVILFRLHTSLRTRIWSFSAPPSKESCSN